MQSYERKQYQIPRKVSGEFTLFGLTTRNMLFLFPVFIVDLIVIFTSNWPIGGRIVFTVFTGGLLYMLLSQSLANGLKISEYVKLLYRFYFVDQNIYTFYTSKKRRADVPHRELLYLKPKAAREKEIVVSDYEQFERPRDKDPDLIQQELDSFIQEYGHYIPKNKDLSKGGR